MLIVLTGKTASGKDTIKKALLAYYPKLRKVITTTSRKLRPGEKNKVDYYFINREEFNRKIKNGEFLEYVTYGGNLYGTTKKELENVLDHHDVLWKMDPSRAGQIRDFFSKKENIVVIYITTSDDVILKRLNKRNLSAEMIDKRMGEDQNIWKLNQGKYDFVVENVAGELDQTIRKIIKITETHRK
ncbi:hypothetical protein A3B45_04075 [Candidatus Daviesbacteria bacterium RIFCSPLOWO2_01_FULL_39_12]|uniref:Guanylate kinase n=1 Tax=Candidatus Daviesbacteria bacterium RIFCSPLOWO2_01_FULL_39_12 TaxID=1797785 RepID=A0A1F5KSF7_9BACT|nr:MAG: hypothetical protein A3D79_01090 [Candidatus Daviesbacteria bacterium RIFCSPHIGHO2_02_FULL_39_8]OGE43755.1 MAG: hypothetical protein A3B45_04075 [Candidatus Daviesbacteria bacterium RIFCSPLOWO2_01_FULL_39_12]